MTEVIVTGLAGLAVAVALYGLAKQQLYEYKLNKRVRALRRIRRGR